MLYRAAAVLIVLFWLTMTGLLLRNEITPGDSALREVPVGHVIKLMLHHQQPSDLNITSDKLRLGQIRIVAQGHKADQRTFAFNGNIHFPIPGAKSQRVAWDGEIEMNKELEVRLFRLGIRIQDASNLRSEITVDPQKKVATYELRSPTGILERQTYTLDERGAQEVFLQLGIDPSLFPTGPLQQRGPPPVIKAQQSSITVHGEPMDTYLVTIEANGQTWLECHVNQLGQIVRATTLLGYSFAPDDISP